MLEAAETGERLEKAEYEALVPELRLKLINAQYDLRSSSRPVLVLVAGDDRLGATSAFNRLHEWMDARYLVSRAFTQPGPIDHVFPGMWPAWTNLPPAGHMGLFLGGFVQTLLRRRVLEEIDDRALGDAIRHIEGFEKSFRAEGGVIEKIWVHLPLEKHRKRLAKAKNGNGDYRVDENDWRIYDNYEAIRPLAEEILRRTGAAVPWHLVEGNDARHRDASVGRIALSALELAVAPRPEPAATVSSASAPAASTSSLVLDTVDLSANVDADTYKTKLAKQQRRLHKLVEQARAAQLRTVLVFEGWDAAGKGGVIRRLTTALDARDYRVIPIAAPDDYERRFHYLWRFWNRLVPSGKVVVFDRSWYGRVLVERVEGFASEEAWSRAYGEINDFEEQLVEDGSVVLKFWLHLHPDEQLRRFQEREKTPFKKYKITEEDYRNRDQWPAYEHAVHGMVAQTSTEAAPWHLVAANDKRWARLQVIETVCAVLKKSLKARS